MQDKLNYALDPNDISVLHRLREKRNRNPNEPDRRDIYVKFCRRSTKIDLLEASRKSKVPNLYVNEALTPLRQKIAYVLRAAKRKCPNIVSGSSTQDGKNIVWVYPPNRNAPGARTIKHAVHTYSRIDRFCRQTLDVPLTDFVSNWDH